MIYLLSINEDEKIKSFLNNHPFITYKSFDNKDGFIDFIDLIDFICYNGEKNYFIIVYNELMNDSLFDLLEMGMENQFGLLILEKNLIEGFESFPERTQFYLYNHEEEDIYKSKFINTFCVFNDDMVSLYEKHNDLIDTLYGEEKLREKEEKIKENKFFLKKREPRLKIKSRFSKKTDVIQNDSEKDFHKKDICCFKGDKINYSKLFGFNFDFNLKIEFLYDVDLFYKFIYFKILLIYSNSIDEINTEILQKCIDNKVLIVCVSGKKNIDEYYSNNIIFLEEDDNLALKLNKMIKEYGNININDYVLNDIIETDDDDELFKSDDKEQIFNNENKEKLDHQQKPEQLVANKSLEFETIFQTKEKKNINKEQSSIALYRLIEEKIYGTDYKHDFGFIIIRYVDCERINQYWNESVRCIKKNYPEKKIVIIDDNSNKNFLKQEEDVNLDGVDIFYSEHPKKGETLGYYYMYKYKLFEKGIVIHDSVFINQPFLENYDFNHIDIKFLWHFTHHWDNILEEEKILVDGGLSRLVEKYQDKDSWVGCFGVMSIIEYDFLNNIEVKYSFFKNVFPLIHNRDDRCHIERIFAFLCFLEKPSLIESPSLFGIIHHFVHWGYLYEYYLDYKQKVENGEAEQTYPILKVWSGR